MNYAWPDVDHECFGGSTVGKEKEKKAHSNGCRQMRMLLGFPPTARLWAKCGYEGRRFQVKLGCVL